MIVKNNLIIENSGWIASEAVLWAQRISRIPERDLSALFNFYRKCGLFSHAVDKEKPFFNDNLFFRFESVSKNSGNVKDIILKNIRPLFIVNHFYHSHSILTLFSRVN
jgi:hypothetical protein